MVSQLLFGELLEIKDVSNGWLQVSIEHDGYMGWIDEKQCTQLDKGSFAYIRELELSLVTDPVAILEQRSGQRTYIVAGSSLAGLQNNQLILAGTAFNFKGSSVKWKETCTRSSLVHYAVKYRCVPYMWGGRTPFGIDCSGFTQMVYRMAGIPLYRDVQQQALQGQVRGFAEEAQPGDLAFFDDEEGRIIHTGIVLEEGKIIHASGSVRIDTLDHQGIFNRDSGSYTHMLRVIRYHI
jgi:hypothetical protein